MTLINAGRQGIVAAAAAFRPLAPTAVMLALLCSFALAMVTVLHELMLAAIGGLLGSIAELTWLAALLRVVPFDPIYTNAAIETASQIKVAGVAVAGAPGAFLHAILPDVFAAPELAQGWLSAVFWPGGSVMANGIALFVSRVAMLSLGLLAALSAFRRAGCWRRALRSRYPVAMLVFGVLAQAFVIWRALESPPTLGDLEAFGLSFAFGVLFPGFTGRRMAISDLSSSWQGPFVELLAMGLTLLAAYGLASLCARTIGAMQRTVEPLETRLPCLGAVPTRRRRLLLSLVTASAGLMLLTGIIGAQSEPIVEPSYANDTHPSETETLTSDVALTAATPPPSDPDQPSRVGVTGEPYSFAYHVNARRQFIRGMGYNPMYSQLDPDKRAARYDRDFQLMRQSNVNTVFGWTAAEFDRLLLDKAHQYGLGVALPYELAPNANYEDLSLQDSLKTDVLRWVEQYKQHPALRMWAVGNEVLHKLVYPSWLPLNRNSAQAIARAKAFARFYVALADAIHEADPNHPVLLRDAEDAYFSWMRDALVARPASRRWLIYGTNIYTRRLTQVVEGWPKQNAGIALLISEFAPGGLSSRDRPDGYRSMWATLTKRRDWILGGVPYVWTTAGPEEVDRAFGLVDAAGTPVDGSLQAITGVFAATPDVEPRTRDRAQIY